MHEMPPSYIDPQLDQTPAPDPYCFFHTKEKCLNTCDNSLTLAINNASFPGITQENLDKAAKTRDIRATEKLEKRSLEARPDLAETCERLQKKSPIYKHP